MTGSSVLNMYYLLEYLYITSYYKQLSADIKIKNYKIKTSFVSTDWPKAQTNETGIILIIFI